MIGLPGQKEYSLSFGGFNGMTTENPLSAAKSSVKPVVPRSLNYGEKVILRIADARRWVAISNGPAPSRVCILWDQPEHSGGLSGEYGRHVDECGGTIDFAWRL